MIALTEVSIKVGEAQGWRFGVPERRACPVIGQARSTQRLPLPTRSDDEQVLRTFLRAFVLRRPRWGWRRAADSAWAEGWQINNMRIHRLWRDEGLRVPHGRRKKPRRSLGVHLGNFRPIRPVVVWVLAIQFDQTADGRTLKVLNDIDEFTCEALAISVERSINADDVVACLERIAAIRAAPAFVRFDNGPELVAHAVADWCRFNTAGALSIGAVSPWQNAWVASFNARLRDEHLNGQLFDSLLEAKVLTEDWRIDYNTNRTHSGLGRNTPLSSLRAGSPETSNYSRSEWLINWDPLS